MKMEEQSFDSPVASRANVLIINTGGAGAEGNPSPELMGDAQSTLSKDIDEMDEFRRPTMPKFDIVDMNPLLHGADIGAKEWAWIANTISGQYHNYNGFVIVHGTDTLCWTATALSFMLMNLGKPVMLTGSLIPAKLVHTDLKRNLILALLFAASDQICEVCVVFAEKLFRGNRCTKLSGVSLQPFDSPFYPPLATMVGQKMQPQFRLLRPAPTGRMIAFTDMSAKVLTIKLVPGMLKETLVGLVDASEASAVVIVAFGTGNTPTRGGAVKAACERANERNMIVVIASQVRSGAVSLTDYEAGRQMMVSGVIGSADMTVEATVLKLKYLLGRGYSKDEVKKLMSKDLRGEISEPDLISKL